MGKALKNVKNLRTLNSGFETIFVHHFWPSFKRATFFFGFQSSNALLKMSPLKSLDLIGKCPYYYAFFIPIQMMEASLYGVIRALNLQKEMIWLQIFSNYIVHYAVLSALLGATSLTNLAFL